MADWRLRLRISFAFYLASGISPAPLVPVLGTVSTSEVQIEREHYYVPSSLPVSAHCGWRVSRARHTACALARHRSECEFYLEHFVVQLYLYVVCILCIYTLVYF